MADAAADAAAARAPKLRAQVEFYFSDSNLPKDKFLLDAVGPDAAGTVPLATIAGFAKIRELLGLGRQGRRAPKAVDDEHVKEVIAALKVRTVGRWGGGAAHEAVGRGNAH